MASDMTLYWISGSPPCWRVVLCLEEKKVKGYTSKQLSYEKAEQKAEEYLKINPRGQVPAFKDGNILIQESVATCLYLEDKFKSQGTCLLPADPASKATALQRMLETSRVRLLAQLKSIFVISSVVLIAEGAKGDKTLFYLVPLLNKSQNVVKNVFEEYMALMWFKKPESQDKELMKVRAEKAAAELDRWEKYLEQLGPGSYISGKDFTIADVVFLPNIGLMVWAGLDLTRRPHLKAYYEMASQRPSFKASTPTQYANGEGKDFLKDI